MKKTIGILGGMGPESTAYFYNLIIKYTLAEKDQDHIPVVIYSNPEIPPRTDAILKKTPSPLPHLRRGVKILRQAGADFIVMPCVTAHYYYPELISRARIPLLNLLDETLLYVERKMSRLKWAGLLASNGTIKSKLFHDSFAMGGIEVITPNQEDQQEVMEAIFGTKGIKAGYTTGEAREIIHYAALKLVQKGAQAVIAGCTEVPLVLREDDLEVPLIDPLKIMAEVCILHAGYPVKKEIARRKLKTRK